MNEQQRQWTVSSRDELLVTHLTIRHYRQMASLGVGLPSSWGWLEPGNLFDNESDFTFFRWKNQITMFLWSRTNPILLP